MASILKQIQGRNVNKEFTKLERIPGGLLLNGQALEKDSGKRVSSIFSW
jgi:hypothetical protein